MNGEKVMCNSPPKTLFLWQSIQRYCMQLFLQNKSFAFFLRKEEGDFNHEYNSWDTYFKMCQIIWLKKRESNVRLKYVYVYWCSLSSFSFLILNLKMKDMRGIIIWIWIWTVKELLQHCICTNTCSLIPLKHYRDPML